jgi:hypothetical protein
MYEGRTLRVLNTLPALLLTGALAVSSSPAADAATALVFNYPTGFTSSNVQTAWAAGFVGSALNLTNTGLQHEAGGAWYKTQQNIASFTTDFTFRITPSGSVPSIQGITFCIQNTNSANNPTAYGTNASSDANLAGYGSYALGGQVPLKNSVAILFNLNDNSQYNYPVGGHPSATGLFINGGPVAALIPENDLNPSKIDFYSGHVMAAHIVYDGSILTMTLRDTSTNAQLRTSWPVDIPSIVGSSNAWVGFTGGEIPTPAQDVLTWDFYSGYNTKLATPTFSVAPGQYASAQSVSISGPAGATIYYTTNGQQPTSSSSQYTGPISVSSSEIVQAVAIQSGYTDSPVGVANYQIAAAGAPLINFSSFASAANLVTVNGTAKLTGSALQLTDSSTYNESASAWYDVPVNVQSFTTNFTLQLTNPQANGMTFTIQNQPPASSDTSILYVSGGPNALANSASGLGYSGSTGGGGQIAGLLSSVAVKFDLYTGSGNTTGLYTNGADTTANGIDMSSSGLSLHSGNPLNVSLTYSGTTLAMTITDSKTKASFSKSWSVNIPATVGGNTAYVGFTGGTGGMMATQQVLAWTYSTASSSGGSTGTTPPAVPNAPSNVTVQ